MYITCPTIQALPDCYLIFEQDIHQVGGMKADAFERFLRAYATTEHRVEVLLDQSVGEYDTFARYYLISEIMSWNKDVIAAHRCILYASKQEAEDALHPVEQPVEQKRGRRKAA